MSFMTSFIGYSLVSTDFAAAGAATAVAVSHYGSKYRHLLAPYHINTEFGIQNRSLVATIGVIQSFFPIFVAFSSEKLGIKIDSKRYSLIHFMTAAALVGVTFLAEQKQMISGKLGVAAAISLAALTYMENRAIMALINSKS